MQNTCLHITWRTLSLMPQARYLRRESTMKAKGHAAAQWPSARITLRRTGTTVSLHKDCMLLRGVVAFVMLASGTPQHAHHALLHRNHCVPARRASSGE